MALIIFCSSNLFSSPINNKSSIESMTKEVVVDKLVKNKEGNKIKTILVNKVNKTKEFLERTGIDLKNPNRKWLHIAMIALAVGTTCSIISYGLTLGGVSYYGVRMLSFAALIITRAAKISFMVWLAKITEKEKRSNELSVDQIGA